MAIIHKYMLKQHNSIGHAELARGADEEVDEEALK